MPEDISEQGQQAGGQPSPTQAPTVLQTREEESDESGGGSDVADASSSSGAGGPAGTP